MIEWSFENWKYGGYPQFAVFGDLPIINEQMLFTKLPVDRWNNNILKRLKVSSIKLSFDNGIYVSNTRNAYFNNLPFMVIKFWSLDEEYIV